MKYHSRIWIAGYFAFVLSALGIVAGFVIRIDPFFHYHKPAQGYYYTLSNQRSQNDGISKSFDYDALITGTSMTENFKTSELDEIFGVHSIKVAYSGGSYKEINDNLINALEHNPGLKLIVRSLDVDYLISDKDAMRTELGTYPTYLYDRNPFNDVRYIFNRNVVFDWVYPMTQNNDKDGFVPGITSFDEYSNWMSSFKFGVHTVCPNGIGGQEPGDPVHLTEVERAMVLENVRQNVTSLAEKYPSVLFYYFIPPYSAANWEWWLNDGRIYKQVEAEQVMIEEILPHENIKLYSFNLQTEITTDLNHYKDSTHYASWINSLMLRWMHDGCCLLTEDNYQDYLSQELSFYTACDYSQLGMQEDYESDHYAAALLCRETYGCEPLVFSEELLRQSELNAASIVSDAYDGTVGIECRGAVQRDYQKGGSIGSYLIHSEYIGCKIRIEDIEDFHYLVFCGRKSADHGQPYVAIYDEDGQEIKNFSKFYPELDNGWHRYTIALSGLSGAVDIIFNGGYTDSTGSPDSLYTFSGMTLY